MQLRLETDELNLIANILLEREGDQASLANGAAPGARSGQDSQMYEELLNKILARDMKFDSDELVQLADILGSHKRVLKEKIAKESTASVKAELQKRLARLEPALERIEEACVMF